MSCGVRDRALRVLVVAHAFPPAYRGGSIRTLEHLTSRLGCEIEFFVITRTLDYGEKTPLDVEVATWVERSGAQVWYERPWRRTPWRIASLARAVDADVLFVNSMFAPGCVSACLARRVRLLDVALLVAPEGEFNAASLAHHPRRKRWFLRVARLLALHKNAHWRASTEDEAVTIRARVDTSAGVSVAACPPPLLESPPVQSQPEGSARPARLVYLSIISARKAPTRAARFVLTTAETTLDVFGPSRDDRELAALTDLIADDSSGRIRFHGPLDHRDVASTLGSYDALILPTAGESFGYVIGEALLAGCLVLVSDRTPWQDLDSCGAGWVIDLEDDRAWHSALAALAAMSPDERAASRVAARERGEQWARDTTADDRWRELFAAVGGCGR